MPTLLLRLALLGGALWARRALGLAEPPAPFRRRRLSVVAGLGAIATSDCIVHGLLQLALGERYLRHYRALVFYFAPQRTAEIVAGGLLAAGEELFFRGLLLRGMEQRLGWRTESGGFALFARQRHSGWLREAA
jgi:membrane protease YdiL (CAAX protease family)